MALTCDFPQLLQAYVRLISNALYLGLSIYFTLRPTVVSESLKNLNINRFEVLTAVLMKSQVFFGLFPVTAGNILKKEAARSHKHLVTFTSRQMITSNKILIVNEAT
jgi:hypothetical protein